MREEFEAWVKSNWPNQSLDRFNPLHGVTEGEYMGFTVQHCWDAWQASREAIEVELPVVYQDSPDPLYEVAYAQKCRESIEALGLKVKP